MCKLMLMFVLFQIFWTVSGFEGTLFSEISFEAPIDDFSDKNIITYDMYTLTNNIHDLNYPTTINSHAFQLYFAPAKIIHISTIYDFVISEDRHNSIVYSLNGINTTYLASIYVLVNKNSKEILIQNFVNSSRVEYVDYSKIKTFQIDWRTTETVVLRNNILPHKNSCYVAVQTFSQNASSGIVGTVQVPFGDFFYNNLIQYTQESWNLDLSENNYYLSNSTCEDPQFDDVRDISNFNLSRVIDETVTIDEAQTFVIEYAVKFQSLSCEFLRTDNTNLYQLPILQVFENILYKTVIAISNTVNVTDSNNNCIYKLFTTYSNKTQAILAFQYLNRVPVIHDKEIIDHINIYSVPNFTFVVKPNEINTAEVEEQDICDYSFDINASVFI